MPYSNANGVDIWYEVKGDGPAMVLVHANPFDHDLWLYQAAHFSTWFKVVGIDIRGYGRSSKVTQPYALIDMVEDVVGVMNDLKIARAVLMGCSVGSGTAILLGRVPAGDLLLVSSLVPRWQVDRLPARRQHQVRPVRRASQWRRAAASDPRQQHDQRVRLAARQQEHPLQFEPGQHHALFADNESLGSTTLRRHPAADHIGRSVVPPS